MNPFIEHPAKHNTRDYDKWEQWEFRFANGYGASVVKGENTYGWPNFWEVAVLGPHGDLDYTTPITDDVIGWLDENAVRETLRQIALLPA